MGDRRESKHRVFLSFRFPKHFREKTWRGLVAWKSTGWNLMARSRTQLVIVLQLEAISKYSKGKRKENENRTEMLYFIS